MKEIKSTELSEERLDGAIVSLPGNRKKGRTLAQYKDDTLGKIGTNDRDLYESELRMDIIQDLIRDVRKQRNLSQQALGDIIGVNKSQISKIEKGYDNISLVLLSRIFKALNATIKISVKLQDQELELI